MPNKLILLIIITLSFDCFSQPKNDEMNISDKQNIELIIDVSIKPIQFEMNSNELVDIEYLKKVCSDLIKLKVKKILLTGHCTNKELKLNTELSKSRLEKTYNLMIEFGLDPKIIQTRDYKAEQPKESTGNDKINQRVELIILQT